MTIQQIYDLAVRLGIQTDLRGAAGVRKKLQKERARYEKLTGVDKEEFDTERLTNPYSDSRVNYGKLDRQVKRVMAGIDLDGSEIILAKELSKTKPIDLLIAHHPVGIGLAALDEVMHMQAEISSLYGVPINIAESLQRKRISEVARSISAINHNKVVDLARLFDMPLMSAHTVTDNMVANFLKKQIARNIKDFDSVGDVMDWLKTIPEYQEAISHKAGPRLFAGSRENSVGKIALTEITGGTEGSKDMYSELSRVGIGTIIGMHMTEERKNEAEKHHINAIIAGHISSDSIGLNLFLDELEKRGIEVVPAGGLIRVSRVKKSRRSNKKR